MKNQEEFKSLGDKDIHAKVLQLKKDVFRMKMEKETTGLQKGHLLRQSKRDIARLLTVLSQRKGN